MVLSLVLRYHGIGKVVIAENSCYICCVYSIFGSHNVSGFKKTLKFLWFNHSQSSRNLHQMNTQCLNIPNNGELIEGRSSSESSRKSIIEVLKSLLFCKCERNIQLDQWPMRILKNMKFGTSWTWVKILASLFSNSMI